LCNNIRAQERNCQKEKIKKKNWAHISDSAKRDRLLRTPHKNKRQKRKKRDQKTREYDVELYK